MKNTNRLIPLFLSLLLLSGCSAPAPAQTDAVTQTAAAESSGQTAEPTDAQPGDPFADSRFMLYEDDTVRIELIYSLNESGTPTWYLYAVRSSEAVEEILLTDVVVNGKDHAGDIWLSFYDDRIESIAALPRILPQEDAAVQSLRFGVEINWEPRQTVDVQIPADLKLQLVFLPTLDALAGPQTLYDEYGLRLTLLGAGLPAWEYLGSSSVHCAVSIENNTAETLIFSVPGIRINRSFEDSYGSDYAVLPPNTKTFFLSCIYLSEDSVSSIGELAVQFNIEAEERPEGYDLPLGTLWCPVTLAMHGELEMPQLDEVIYEDDTVRIGVVGRTMTDYAAEEYSFLHDEGIRYEWELIVENKSDRDLQVVLEDVLTDGMIEGYTASCNVGAHSFAGGTLFYFDPDSGERQGAKFSLRLFEQEQAVLIRRVEDRIRIDP